MNRFKSLPRWAKIVLPSAVVLTLCICGTVSLEIILPERPTTAAVKIIGMLGEQVLVTEGAQDHAG